MHFNILIYFIYFSGYITLEEFSDACNLLRKHMPNPITQEQLVDICRLMDINKDGLVDLNEFLETFRLVDTNRHRDMGDGEDMWQHADRLVTAVDHNDDSTTEWITIENGDKQNDKLEDNTQDGKVSVGKEEKLLQNGISEAKMGESSTEKTNGGT